MLDVLGKAASLRRPGLLVRAARPGVAACSRALWLARLAGASPVALIGKARTLRETRARRGVS